MDKKVEVINKFGQTLAIFTSEDEETIDRMIDPVVTLTQNSDNVFSFSISEKSQKWEDIKSIENLYIVDGHVYSPLFEDSYTHIKTEDGENLIQVRAYERQKMLEKTFVTAWNSETGFADIDAFMVVILSKGNLPLKNGNKATGVEAIVDPGEYNLGSAGYIMKGLLYGTGWDVGIADVEGYFDFETEQLSVYENLLKVQEMYGGILIFDSMNKLVHLRQESNYISYTGYEVRYKKNLKDMELAIDNKIVTRLYVFGEAGLNIASVNDDKIYLENYTYSNEIFEGIESNTDIYEPDQLKAWGERKLLDLCAPRKVLTTNIAYLTQKEGFEQEKLKLNDSVRVYYDEAEFVAPETGVEIVATEIEAEGIKSKKESYITLNGNTNQYTSNGKNILPNDLDSIELFGITITKNRNGTYTINGTSTSNINLSINTDPISFDANTNYFLSGCPSGGSLDTFCLATTRFADIGEGVLINSQTSFSEQVILYISNNVTFNNAIFKPMINVGTEAGQFEPYGESLPNPDYPQEIQTLTGEQTIKISNDAIIVPKEYQRVEYIKSNGNKQYIKTGFAANQDTSIEMEVTTTTLSANAALYCSRKTLNNKTFCAFRINGQLRHDYGNTQTDTSYTLKVNTPYKIYSNKNKLYVNDSLVHTATYTTFQSPYNMLLLASQDNTESAGANYWNGNLYYCKIWDNETLVRNFIPCYRKNDNVVGLYDSVNGEFYANAGTGNFAKGPNVETDDYAINFGDLEFCEGEYTFKNSIENPHYNPNLELNAWYKHTEVRKIELAIADMNNENDYPGWKHVPYIKDDYDQKNGALNTWTRYATNISINVGIGINTKSSGGILWLQTGTFHLNQNEWKEQYPDLIFKIYYHMAEPIDEKITDLALTTQLEALYKATLVSPYSHIYSDSGFPIIDLRYNVITPSLYIESNSDLLRVTGVDYPVFNPSSATLTLGDVTLNTNNIFKKISNTTNAYNAGLIPAGSVKITESDGTARPITQEFEVQHTQNATFEYGIGSLNSRVDNVYTLVDENGDDIKDLEEHVDTFEQTAYGLINTLKNRSGNNLLRNSSACFGNEFWTGLVKKEATLDEVHKNFFAKSCFNLQNGTLGQQIAVPNGEYYVGFKYKKLIELANCSVDINGTIVELTSMDYETSDNFVQVNDYSITIKLISDTDDACFVGDIMIVAGNKEKWSPNPNEIYYDSVEIGKGIQVNSNTANTYTRIDADGNRIYNRNSDEIVTELTEYGLSTERVECKEIKGAGILIQEVRDKYGDNQTWITKI